VGASEMLFLIIAYLIAALILFVSSGWFFLNQLVETPDAYAFTAAACAAVGGVGGCLYCLRAVYLNKCVRKSWDPDWQIWYFIRPVTSGLAGGASFIFLKAGLILLEAGTKSNATYAGFFALAFIAGLNVDRFIARIEELAESAWGIEKSRASRPDNNSKKSRRR
jgi:hypothetical protein